jgi:hypothetical protein
MAKLANLRRRGTIHKVDALDDGFEALVCHATLDNWATIEFIGAPLKSNVKEVFNPIRIRTPKQHRNSSDVNGYQLGRPFVDLGHLTKVWNVYLYATTITISICLQNFM